MEGIVPQGAGEVLVLASVVDCTGMVRVPPAAMDGPEKGSIPLNPAAEPLVSTRRQGVTATKVRAVLDRAVGESRNCGAAFWDGAFAP
ncbi:MAG: hypothetical protein ABSH56_17200 [Bryobacteraceae bacterium]|jgi:hypothetical protein